METSAPVLHDAILLGIGIAAVYLVVAVLQLLQLKSLQAPPRRPEQEPSLGIVEEDAQGNDESFAARLQQSQTETLLKRLQSEVERLDAELQSLRSEMRRREDKSALPVTQKAPERTSKYSDAMRYAQHGMSAVGIAQKCAISLREAELVASLNRDTHVGRAHGGQRAAA